MKRWNRSVHHFFLLFVAEKDEMWLVLYVMGVIYRKIQSCNLQLIDFLRLWSKTFLHFFLSFEGVEGGGLLVFYVMIVTKTLMDMTQNFDSLWIDSWKQRNNSYCRFFLLSSSVGTRVLSVVYLSIHVKHVALNVLYHAASQRQNKILHHSSPLLVNGVHLEW